MSNRVGTGGGGVGDSERLVTNTDAIPRTLQEHDNWLVARLSPVSAERDKRPLAPTRGYQHPENCLGFEEAVQRAYELGASSRVRTDDGEATVLAFMLGGSPFVGIDLDDVGSPDELTSEAEQIIEKCDTWTEASQSGDGYHAIGRGNKTVDRCRADLHEVGHLEVYDSGRYFCLTGNWLEKTSPEVQSIDGPLDWIEAEYLRVEDKFESDVHEAEPDDAQEESNLSSDSSGGRSLTDIATASAKTKVDSRSHQYRPGQTKCVEIEDTSELTVNIVRLTGFRMGDGDFRRLWFGSNVGKPSNSEADLAFVCKLSYWCRSDRDLMDQCYRASKRYGIRDESGNPKWDCVHYANGDTYGEGIIKKALRENPRSHSGRYIVPDS